MTVTILVEPEADHASCSNCGERIPLSRRKQDNWEFCLSCDEPLVLVDASTGQELNQTWAALESPLEKLTAQAFDVSRFPSQAVAQSWKAFEKKYPREVIEEAIGICREAYARRGQKCWSEVMAYTRARKQGVDPSVVTPSDSGGIAL